MVVIAGVTVFTAVIALLVAALLLVEAKIVQKGDVRIVINGDEEKSIDASSGTTLLSALSENDIFIPSACGGGGACGMCKCKVEDGNRGVLPTELAHLSRREKKENIRLACQLKVKENRGIRLPDEIFNVRKSNATVNSTEPVATLIRELILEIDPGDDIKFQAGQYIQIDIPEYELSFSQFRIRVAERFRPDWDRFDLWGMRAKNQEPIFRAYSLSNPPYESSVLKFTIRIATPPPGVEGAPPGTGSSFIFNLKPGDKIALSGPYGDFLARETEREMCYIGGGAGMAPLRSHILHQLNSAGTKRKMSFWYGARSRQELFFADEFNGLDEKFDNFSYHVALSHPMLGDEWNGMTGFIHERLKENYLISHVDPTEIEYYLCGPPMMLDAILNMLDDLGVEPEMIAYDKF